jgi:hypothetical protein
LRVSPCHHPEWSLREPQPGLYSTGGRTIDNPSPKPSIARRTSAIGRRVHVRHRVPSSRFDRLDDIVPCVAAVRHTMGVIDRSVPAGLFEHVLQQSKKLVRVDRFAEQATFLEFLRKIERGT